MAAGAACAMVTVFIWSGWNIISRLGTTESLDAGSITFLRFLVAGVIAMPIVWRWRHAIAATKKHLLLMMMAGAGAPYVWIASLGFRDAPASHGVLIPGAMMLWVALLSMWILKEEVRPLRRFGYALLALTIITRVAMHSGSATLGADLCFLAASLLWAGYTIANKLSGLPPLAVAALVSLASMLGFSLPYGATHLHELQQLPMVPVITQMVYQGVIVSFVALVCYNHAIRLIDASRASAFTALIPLVTTLLAVPALQEYPTTGDLLCVGMLTFGVAFATGALRYVPWMCKKDAA
jgi:drug/metabolite transporter (DMT)-like permease